MVPGEPQSAEQSHLRNHGDHVIDVDTGFGAALLGKRSRVRGEDRSGQLDWLKDVLPLREGYAVLVEVVGISARSRATDGETMRQKPGREIRLQLNPFERVQEILFRQGDPDDTSRARL